MNLFTLTIPATDSQGNAIDIDDVFRVSLYRSEFWPERLLLLLLLTRQVTLNQAAVLTNAAATITLGTPRETRGEQLRGVMLESGATRIVNSDIADIVTTVFSLGSSTALHRI